MLHLCGQGQNRTGDTRLFRPLLYQLSYLSEFSCSEKTKCRKLRKIQDPSNFVAGSVLVSNQQTQGRGAGKTFQQPTLPHGETKHIKK